MFCPIAYKLSLKCTRIATKPLKLKQTAVCTRKNTNTFKQMEKCSFSLNIKDMRTEANLNTLMQLQNKKIFLVTVDKSNEDVITLELFSTLQTGKTDLDGNITK